MDNNFSISLGLTDYINPILYTITSLVIILNINNIMLFPDNIIYIIGVIISLIFGYTIPTIKLLVGLGKIEFKLPVNIVFYVNSGIFLSGIMLLKNILNINYLLFIFIIISSLLLLIFIYLKTKKFNNIAVLCGALGYLMIYISLIVKALSNNNILSVILYFIAIMFYLLLIVIGLKDARVHWVIEISNIICQLLVMISTIILLIS